MAMPNQILNQPKSPYELYNRRIEEWDTDPMSVVNLVVARCHEAFKRLLPKYKPRPYGTDNEFIERTVLAGIAVVGPNGAMEHESIAHGMKCIPRTQVANAKGCVLHDSHAEIVIMRLFNRHLLEEVEKMINGRPCNANDGSKLVEYQSKILQWRGASSDQSSDKLDRWQPPFKIKDDLRIFLYCSEIPCGDASIELVMSRQKDQTPWPIDDSGVKEEGLKGRADSRATGSKSCSDKLALKQCTSVLSSLTSAFVSPYNAYIDTIILPNPQYDRDACIRSFGPEGRMKAMKDKRWANGYHYRPLNVATTTLPFAHARPFLERDSSGVNRTGKDRIRNSNGTAISNPTVSEATINGVLQGRRQQDPKGATAISRVSMMDLALRIKDSFQRLSTSGQDHGTTAPPPLDGKLVPKSRSPRTLKLAALLVDLSNSPAAPGFVGDEAQLNHRGGRGGGMDLFEGANTYYEAKRDLAFEARRQVKRDVTTMALQNWTPNEFDDFPIGLSSSRQ